MRSVVDCIEPNHGRRLTLYPAHDDSRAYQCEREGQEDVQNGLIPGIANGITRFFWNDAEKISNHHRPMPHRPDQAGE